MNHTSPSAHWKDPHYRPDPIDALASDIGQDALTLVDDDEALASSLHDLLDEDDPQVVKEMATLLRQAIDGRGYPALKMAILRSLSRTAADAIQERSCGAVPDEFLSLALAYVSAEIGYGLLRRMQG